VTPRIRASGVLPVVRGVANAVLVTHPGSVLRAVSTPAPRPARWVVRLLGARVVLQQVAVLAVPTRPLVLLGAAVDALHAASMVATALASPRYRRAAALSAATASGSAVLGLLTAPAAPPRPEG
jgi:hypothetical protein